MIFGVLDVSELYISEGKMKEKHGYERNTDREKERASRT